MAPAGNARCSSRRSCRAPSTTETLWVVPFWVALAVRAALLEFGVRRILQWPNDLLLGDGKVAGVLCQSSRQRVARRGSLAASGSTCGRPGGDAGIDPPPAYCDDVALVDRARCCAESSATTSDDSRCSTIRSASRVDVG